MGEFCHIAWNNIPPTFVKRLNISQNINPKNMRTQNLLLIAFATLMALSFASCQKDKTDQDTSASEDEALSTLLYDDIMTIADDAMFGDVNLRLADPSQILPGPCATKTLDTTVTPHVLTIDFGPTNCLCADGKYRRGQIVTTFTGHYRDSGTVITHTPTNYFVNDNAVMGSTVVTNMGHNANNNLYYTIVVNGTIIKALGGDTITHTANREREWILGVNTPQRQDDVYLITGTSSVSSTNGHSATAVITSALRRELSCKGIVSGTMSITPLNKPVRVLDYGNGNCDKFATVTVNGVTYNIILHH